MIHSISDPSNPLKSLGIGVVTFWLTLPTTVVGSGTGDEVDLGGASDMSRWSPSIVAIKFIGRLTSASGTWIGSSWMLHVSRWSKLLCWALSNILFMVRRLCCRRFWDLDMAGRRTLVGLKVARLIAGKEPVVLIRHVDKESTFPRLDETSKDFLDCTWSTINCINNM